MPLHLEDCVELEPGDEAQQVFPSVDELRLSHLAEAKYPRVFQSVCRLSRSSEALRE